MKTIEEAARRAEKGKLSRNVRKGERQQAMKLKELHPFMTKRGSKDVVFVENPFLAR
jgi:hypothetical protein